MREGYCGYFSRTTMLLLLLLLLLRLSLYYYVAAAQDRLTQSEEKKNHQLLVPIVVRTEVIARIKTPRDKRIVLAAVVRTDGGCFTAAAAALGSPSKTMRVSTFFFFFLFTFTLHATTLKRVSRVCSSFRVLRNYSALTSVCISYLHIEAY